MILVLHTVLLLSISHNSASFTLDSRQPPNAPVRGYHNRHKNIDLPFISSRIFRSKISTMGQTFSSEDVVITDLARYAIKGFSGDDLESVMIPRGGIQTFPDDRRFALLKESSRDLFDTSNPEWLHKANFLCAFSAPELMASFRSHYEIVESSGKIERLLTLYRRNSDGTDASSEPVLGPIDLSLPSGEKELTSFFSKEWNEPLICVSKDSDGKISTFQFGNTMQGVKKNPAGDTRTVHIINSATIREFSEKTGLHLSAMQFRPNIIIDGLKPWEEFSWVGKTLRVVPKDDDTTNTSRIEAKVLSRTVRCEGIGIDPLCPSTGNLDVPKLLTKNYPEHGPYLGVYASLEVVGGDDEDDGGKLLSVGDKLKLM